MNEPSNDVEHRLVGLLPDPRVIATSELGAQSQQSEIVQQLACDFLISEVTLSQFVDAWKLSFLSAAAQTHAQPQASGSTTFVNLSPWPTIEIDSDLGVCGP